VANRYWVGGTASWDGTAGTKWAATSNGTGGETVPTTADDVFFDASSTGTVTIATGNTGAKSINCTGFAGTVTGAAAISVAGSVTLSAGMTYSHTGTMTITATGTVTTAGKTFSNLNINGNGIAVTLGDAINLSSRSLLITQGNFNTANFSVAAGIFDSSNSNVRTVSLGSSTITVGGGTSFDISFGTTTNLTFNAGTSQINIASNVGGFDAGNLTFNNVAFTSGVAGTRTLTGSSTFNNLTLGAPTTNGMAQLAISGSPIVTGTFTCAGANPLRRTFVRSNTPATARTITAAAISADNSDFRDITLAGAAAGATPARAGDCGGNSGITFPAAKTVYRVGINGSWAGVASWALGSGGNGSDLNFPLAQDTAVINNDTALTTTLSLAIYNIGSLDCSDRTTGITLSYSSSAFWHGYHKLGAGVTPGSSLTQTFLGRDVIMDFSTAGKTIPFPITVEPVGGTFRLADSLLSSSSISLNRGTFDANNFNLTCTSFTSSTTNNRTITMGSGLWTLSGTGTVWNPGTSIPPTLNKDTANILLSNTSTNARTFTGIGLSYNKLTIGGATGTSVLSIVNVASFTEIASTKTVAHTIRFSSVSQPAIGTWSVTGTAGNVVTVDSNIAGTRRYFSLTNVATGIDYLSVKDTGESSGGKFYVGANSIDGGNNDNVYFSAPLLNKGDMFAMFASA
jgi:hypothetical protein